MQKEIFQLKELEKRLPKEKGISRSAASVCILADLAAVVQAVEEVLRALVDGQSFFSSSQPGD